MKRGWAVAHSGTTYWTLSPWAPTVPAYAGTLSGIMSIRDCQNFNANSGKCKDK